MEHKRQQKIAKEEEEYRRLQRIMKELQEAELSTCIVFTWFKTPIMDLSCT